VVKDADGDDADSNFEDPEVTSPSSSVTYRVIIDNDSAVPVTIVSLSDNIYDPVTCLDSSLENVVGQTLAADDGDGASPPNGGQDEIACTFVETAPSSDSTTVIDTVTVEAQGSGTVSASDTATIQTPSTPEIDIKPGSFPNSVNFNTQGVIPVAILTTSTFDAADVDPSTVTFEDAAPLRWALEDVDGDGDLDMILHFAKADVTLEPDQTVACLQGSTFSGQQFEVCDSIRIVPPFSDTDGDSSGVGDPPVFGDSVEASLGTDPLDNCSDSGDDDAWPPDIDGDTIVTELDAQPFNDAFGASLGDPLYNARLDLRFDGTIDALDILVLGEFMGTTCSVSTIDSDGDGILDTDDWDDDNDSFADEVELYLGTDHLSACATDSLHNAWPVDFNNDRQVNLLDILALKSSFGTKIGEAAFQVRVDLDADLSITLLDVLMLKKTYRTMCEATTVMGLPDGDGLALGAANA
jgi:hypothetical protein